MEFVRIGDKIIDRDKIMRTMDRIFEIRSEGFSQSETASMVGTDRTFVSRLETMGEVRKGSKIALVGFPILNKEEINDFSVSQGLDKVWIMNDVERWEYIKGRTGEELLADIVSLIAELQELDYIIFIGSDLRIRMMEATMGNKVIGIEIGKSPIETDVEIDIKELRTIIECIRRA